MILIQDYILGYFRIFFSVYMDDIILASMKKEEHFNDMEILSKS
jgi:hypothetical protein